MADDDKDSKTEQATAKHLQDAMSRGQFAKSPEVGLVLILIAAIGAFSTTTGTASREVAAFASHIFGQLAHIRLQLDTAPTEIHDMAIVIAKILVPIIGACVLAGLLAGGLQSGFTLTPEAIGLKFEALDMSNGLERIISKNSIIHACVDMLKVVAIGLVLWTCAKGLFQDPLFTAPVEAAYLGIYMNRATMSFLSRLVLALGVIATISYWYEFMKSRNDLKMSRQEIKDETKSSEGDALTKGAMRRMARRLLQKQMLKQVPTADVIVTNPTHYAVALRYERGKDQAPIILAKGENVFARRIKALAAEHGVPMVENKPVARMLYALGKVDEPIPNELYQAVAEILAFVYRTHKYYFFRLRSRRAEAVQPDRPERALSEAA